MITPPTGDPLDVTFAPQPQMAGRPCGRRSEAEGRRAGGAGNHAGKKIAAWEDDPMIGTATFVMLIAATAIADNAYPPCTQQRTDNCSAQQQAPGPTLYIPCPKGEYCPPHDIPRHKKQR